MSYDGLLIEDLRMFPKWLPSPKAFGQAIVFSLQIIPVSLIASVFTNVLNEIDSNDPTGLVVVFIQLVIIIYLMAMIDQILWRESPKRIKWLPCLRSIGEALWGMFIIISFVIVLVLAAAAFGDKDYMVFQKAGVIYIVSIAYCFHIRNLIFPDKPKHPKKSEEHKESKKPPVDPIEQELNELKAEYMKKKESK